MSSLDVDDKSGTVDTGALTPSNGILAHAELEKTQVDPSKVIRKLDIRLLPFVCFLYVLSFLDRTNIGNAKVAGLTVDLHLTGLQYNLCTAIFFLTYSLFEVPSNVALKLTRPSLWIPLIMFVWGCILISMAFVKNFSGLLIARTFLGVAEAGMFPGITFYLCIWYPRVYQGQRVAVFSSSASLAGAFGGLLASAIQNMEGIGGLAGWSWIFLLEGLITSAVAVAAYFFMSDYPENAAFLTEPERQWLTGVIKADNTGLSKTFKWKYVWQALRDPHAYLFVCIYLFVIIPAYAFALFLPTIVNGLGFSAIHAQLLSVPPNIIGFFFTLLAGRLSDRFRVRGPIVLAGALVSLAGYVILFATESPKAGYAGVMIAACGLFPTVAVILSWTGANFAGDAKKAVVLAMVIGLGNLGGIASSFVYRSQDSPRYHPGHATAISCLCVLIALCAIAMIEYSRKNLKKVAQCERDSITEDHYDEFADAGDASPLYRYTI